VRFATHSTCFYPNICRIIFKTIDWSGLKPPANDKQLCWINNVEKIFRLSKPNKYFIQSGQKIFTHIICQSWTNRTEKDPRVISRSVITTPITRKEFNNQSIRNTWNLESFREKKNTHIFRASATTFIKVESVATNIK
jgi:hypothetical protein